MDERTNQRLQLGTEDLEVDVFGSTSIRNDESKVDLGSLRRRHLDLHLLDGFTDTLDSHVILAQVNTILLEFVQYVFDESGIEFSPLRCVSPFVDFTSTTPFRISRMDISTVPPP